MFVYRLAGHLGRTVAELDDMDATEFAGWLAADQLSPIGGERIDYLFAMQNAVLANLWSKKRWKESQFLPRWGKAAKGASPDQVRAYFAGLKARVKPDGQ